MSAHHYFYRDGENREIGPLPLAAIAQLRQAGVLSDSTLLRLENDTNWVPCREVIAVGPKPTPPVLGNNPSPAINGVAVKRDAWTLMAGAMLCFLLPFVEFSCQNQSLLARTGMQLVTGGEIDVPREMVPPNTEVPKMPPQPNAGIALGAALVATLLGLARRRQTNLAAGVVAAVGVWQLLAMRSAIEGEIHAQAMQALLQIKFETKAGYLGTVTLLTLGAISHFWLYRQPGLYAGEGGGQSLTRGQKRGLGAAALLVALFYLGPVALHSVFNRTPPAAWVRTVALAQLSPALAVGRYRDVVATEVTYGPNGSTEWWGKLAAAGPMDCQVTVKLRQKIDLFQAADFVARARNVGDDQSQMVEAQRLATTLHSAPQTPPASGALPSLFTRISAEGEEFNQRLVLQARKRYAGWQGWRPADCWRSWTDLFTLEKAWDLSGGGAPVTVTDERARGELPNGALILGEPAATQAFNDYLGTRAKYIAAVHAAADAEKSAAMEAARRKRFADAIRDSARTEAVRLIQPATAFVIGSVTVAEESIPPAGGSGQVSVRLSAKQTDDLWQPSREQPAEWSEFKPGAPFYSAKLTARRHFPQLHSPDRADASVYEVTSASGSIWTIDFLADVRDNNGSPEVRGMHLSEGSRIPARETLPLRALGRNALLSGSPRGQNSVADYRAGLAEFTKQVQVALAQRREAYTARREPEDRYVQTQVGTVAKPYDEVWAGLGRLLKARGAQLTMSDAGRGEMATNLNQLKGGGIFGSFEYALTRIFVTDLGDETEVAVRTAIYFQYICSNREERAQELRSLQDRQSRGIDTERVVRDFGDNNLWWLTKPALANETSRKLISDL